MTIPFLSVIPQRNGDQQTNKWKKFIHIETGWIFPAGTIRESVSIRQDISYYYDGYFSSGYVFSETSGLVLGVRYEYFFPGLKSGISTGLRYTGLNTQIGGFSSSKADFFYLRYSMQGSETKFARVKALTEDNYRLSVPLEIRFIPFQYKSLSIYANAGIEYSMISLKKGADIRFENKAMEVNKNAILGNITVPTNKNYSVIYSAIGIKLGKEGKPNYMLDILLPSLFLTKDIFSLVDVEYFEGFKLSVQFPFMNNK